MLMHLVPLLLVKHFTNQISNQIEELVFSISIAHGVRGAQESWRSVQCAVTAGEKGSWQRIADIFTTKDMEQSVSSAMLLSRVSCKALFLISASVPSLVLIRHLNLYLGSHIIDIQ